MRRTPVNRKYFGDNVHVVLQHKSRLFVMVLMEQARHSPISSVMMLRTVSGIFLC